MDKMYEPKANENLTGLLPDIPDMKPVSKKIKSCVRISDTPLLNNISSEEFFWVNLNPGDRLDYFGNAKATAPIGKFEFIFSDLTDAEPLIEPKVLVNYPLGKGNIILDSLDWPAILKTEPLKTIRIINAFARNIGAAVKLKKAVPWKYSFIDISPQANMGYVDEYPDDGKGGWLDMGKADLCFFLINHTGLANGVGAPVAVPPFPEKYRFLGVPFKLTAPKKNNGKAIIALRGKTHSVKLPEKVVGINAGVKADKIWFLHSATYVPKTKGVPIAQYIFRYSDGSTETFTVRSGMEVGDWCGPTGQKYARVAWSGSNRAGLKVGVYLASWENPHPEKNIESIDIIGNLSDSAFAVLGITFGINSVKNNKEQLNSAVIWEFKKNGDTPIQALNTPASLIMKDDGTPNHAPVKEFTFDENGVHLSGKQYFIGNMKNISLYPATVIELSARFAITKTPRQTNSYSYGLFQAMHYRKSGFRIHITKNMRILLELFPSEKKAIYLKSSSQLQAEKFYKIRIRMDGKIASIFINGKLDAMKSSPLPAPSPKADILIGHCSGAGYWEGIISSVGIYTKKV